MFCSKCGREMPDGVKFCSGCGADLTVTTGGNSGNNSGFSQGNAGMGGSNSGAIPSGLNFTDFCRLPQNEKQLKTIAIDYVVTVVIYIVVEVIFSFTGVGLLLWVTVIAAWLCLVFGRRKLSMGWLIASLVFSVLTGNIPAIILTAFIARRLALLRDRYKGYCDATGTVPQM